MTVSPDLPLPPDAAFDAWFDGLSADQRERLSVFYHFMTGSTFDDFFLAGPAALQRFEQFRAAPDFPLRRVGRLLRIRSTFSFILLAAPDSECLPQLPSSLVPLASSFQADPNWAQVGGSWQRLCDSVLNDEFLAEWLATLHTEG